MSPCDNNNTVMTASMVIFKNPPALVREAASSILRTSLKVKLCVIDNSPTPLLQESFTDLPVDYRHSENNLGYGRAHNVCIIHIEPSKYHLIMNPDISFGHGVVEDLIRYMDSHPEIGIVCPKILSPDGSIQYLNRRDPTVLDLFLRRFLSPNLHSRVQKRLAYYTMQDVGYDGICEVPSISGSFMLCRTRALREVGGFDPRYFMYFEDADLTRSLRARGYKTVYYPFVNVTHGWERAAHKNMKMAIVFIINGFRYFRKWGWSFC